MYLYYGRCGPRAGGSVMKWNVCIYIMVAVDPELEGLYGDCYEDGRLSNESRLQFAGWVRIFCSKHNLCFFEQKFIKIIKTECLFVRGKLLQLFVVSLSCVSWLFFCFSIIFVG